MHNLYEKYFVCPRCGNIAKIELLEALRFTKDTESATVSWFDVRFNVECENCRADSPVVSDMFECDTNLVDVLSTLIKNGYHTLYSCAGHNKGSLGYLWLQGDLDLYKEVSSIADRFESKTHYRPFIGFTMDSELMLERHYDSEIGGMSSSKVTSEEYRSYVEIRMEYKEDMVFEDDHPSFLLFLDYLADNLPVKKTCDE